MCSFINRINVIRQKVRFSVLDVRFFSMIVFIPDRILMTGSFGPSGGAELGRFRLVFFSSRRVLEAKVDWRNEEINTVNLKRIMCKNQQTNSKCLSSEFLHQLYT